MSDTTKISIPIEVSAKGLKTFVVDLDEYEVVETGSKEKEINGKKRPVAFMKFKLIEKK